MLPALFNCDPGDETSEVAQALDKLGAPRFNDADPHDFRPLPGETSPETTRQRNSETCPTCGQPDNCGDCDHTPMYEVGDRVKAFDPRTFGVVRHGEIKRLGRNNALIDFGIHGETVVHLAHVLGKES